MDSGSDFVTAANEILTDFGHDMYVLSGGTVTATALAYVYEPGAQSRFRMEDSLNVENPNQTAIYMPGTVSVLPGYRIAGLEGTFVALAIPPRKVGTTNVITEVICRRES